jgi:hypothetical protein
MSIISIVLGLIPTIANTIKSIEELDSTSGKGAHKLQVVLAIVRGLYEAANPNASVAFDQIAKAVEGAISALVTYYNAIGLFKKAILQQG